MQCFSFRLQMQQLFSLFLILLTSFNKQVLLKKSKIGSRLSKIDSRFQGNRRWQPVVLAEEELNHLSISPVIFSKDIVLLYNHIKDVWYFHQKNCRRSKMMLWKVQSQNVFHSDKEYCLVSYSETILNACLW